MASQQSIDIDVDPRLQERHWFLSRIVWLIMLALVIVALLGLTGSGGTLSRQQVTLATAELDIPRVGRWSATDDLTVKVDQPADNGIEILVPAKFGEVFAVEAVSPTPPRSLRRPRAICIRSIPRPTPVSGAWSSPFVRARSCCPPTWAVSR